MAANTAYAGFPRLAALQAADGYLPRQLTYRGSRLVYSRGIGLLAVVASILIWLFDASVTGLIPLYAIGVFLSFTLSQVGMARRWWKCGQIAEGGELRERGSVLHPDPRWRLKMVVNGIGAAITAIVTIIFAVTKFTEGAWMVLILIPVLVASFYAIHRHYVALARQLSLDAFGPPTRVDRHRVILALSGVNRGTLAGLHYARALSEDVTAVYVAADPESAAELEAKWGRWGAGVRLVIVRSPYRLLIEPLLDYIRQVSAHRQANEVLTIVVPQFVPQQALAQPAPRADGSDAAAGPDVRAGDRDHERALPGRRGRGVGMYAIIVGCGRVGSELAMLLSRRGHDVTIIDHVGSSFSHLDPAWRGRTIEAEAMADGVLKRAGIEQAHALASVTNSDAVNAVVAHVASTVYNVRSVVSRNYDPRWLPLHEAMGLRTVSSTAWGAQRLEELLESRRTRPVFSAGNGEVEIYELDIPKSWDGKPLAELLGGIDCVVVSLTHGGRAAMPTPKATLALGGPDPRRRDDRGRDGAARPPLRSGGLSMYVLIAGGGRTAATLALTLHEQKHEVRLMEHRPQVLAHLHRDLPTELVYEGNPTDPRTLELAGVQRGAGAGGLDVERRREPLALLHRPRALPRAAHDRHHQRPAQRLALRQEVPRRRRAQPGRHPGQPDRAGDVARRHDDAAQAAQGQLLARERDAAARRARGRASRSRTCRCRAAR